MVKTPEEYFADQCLAVPQASDATLSVAEQAFVQKYLGSDALHDMPVQEPEQVLAGTAGTASEAHDHAAGAHPVARTHADDQAHSLRTRLSTQDQVQMVSFYIREQIFLLPVSVIVEVLRYMPLTRLPMAPPFIAGVVNLRGKVTPLLHLDALLTTDETMRYTEKSFIIVCGTDDMQLGLIIDKVHTMYMVSKDSISWNIEAQLGEGADFLCGLANVNERLHGIIDPDLIVDKLIEV